MPAPPQRNKLPWHDEFERPTFEQLRSPLNQQARAHFDYAKEKIDAFEDVEAHLKWHGLPWRWSYKYTHDEDDSGAVAYLVPDPSGIKLSVPLTPDSIKSMPAHRFKKHLKEVLGRAKEVDGVYWAHFELAAKSQIDDITDLIRRKLDFALGRTTIRAEWLDNPEADPRRPSGPKDPKKRDDDNDDEGGGESAGLSNRGRG
jgi:hypothetical protein